MSLLADWQMQGSLLALWPYRTDVWRAGAEPAQQALLRLLLDVAPYHPVCLGIHPPELNRALPHLPPDLPWLPLRYDDSWVRDSGPLFVRSTERYQAVAAEFNGWQGVHSVFQRDRLLPRQLSQRFALTLTQLPFIFEGGMLTHDGEGNAIVHERSLRSRNPLWRRSELERQLKQKLGLNNVYWIQTALRLDETGGHVDNQLQFLDSTTLAFADSQNDPDWTTELNEIQQQAWAARYKWLQLPDSRALTSASSDYSDVQITKGVKRRGRMPCLASYVNCVRTPGVIVVPQFAHRSCEESNVQALEAITAGFPKLVVVPADASEMVRGGGGPHCLSLILPS